MNDPRHRPEVAAVADRAAALEATMNEAGLLPDGMVDRIVDLYEEDFGPQNGARVVARAWTDDEYRKRLLADGTAAAAELGISGPEGDQVVVVENTSAVHNVIVCTQCSCTAWPLLGLPPDWYKSPAYRSRVVREARTVLDEMGLSVPDEVAIRVWDTSGDVRYMVLPERPRGTDGLSEEELAQLVTRESLIGVSQPRASTPA